MGSSSITRLPLYLHSILNQNRSFSFLIFQNSPKPFSLLNPVRTPKTLRYSAIPTSKSKSALNLTPEKRISTFISEKLVILALGSFVFLGGLRVGAAVAQPVQESSGVEAGKQKAEAQSGGSEEMIYVKLLEKDPRDVEALKIIVNVMMKKGKTKEAVKYVERLIEVQPREVEWRLLQAFCYEIMGQLTKAKRLFKEILKQEPLLLRALHGLAMVMHKNLEGPAVFEMLNGALEVAHREKRVNKERNIKILIAQMHVVKGDLEEALEKFQILVQENPRDFRPYLCQGIVYSLLDKKKEAEEQFEIYRNLVPEEFPGRGFLDDVMLAAKTESKEQLEKEFKAEYSYSYKS
nr:protein SLOW GREEN 1, chloroplastic [Ipomoea batatas]